MRGTAFIRSSLLISFAFLTSSCFSKPSVTRDKVQEAWDDYNNPALLDSGSVVVFSDLPLSGQVNRIPWADIYWPSYLGGIALRWKNGFETPFQAVRPTEDQVRTMSDADLAALSPAEKYDIFMGRFDYPTVQSELLRNHPAMPMWHGLCHGWASATLNFDEPNAVTLRGSTGVNVPFASGDVKALLAYAQGVVYMPMVRVLGQRCEADLTAQPHLRNSAECRDTNAGSFHLVLSNYVGRTGQSVIADLTRDSEVWNFPIYGYTTRELARRSPSPGAAPQAVLEVVVETVVDYMNEIERPNWIALVDSRSFAAEKVTYMYAVELDSMGRVVGGSWLSEERPDFLWLQERADFRGYYGSIESIYESSVQAPRANPFPVPTPAPDAGTAPVPGLPPLPAQPEPPPAPPAPPTYTPPPLPSIDPSQPIGPILTQPIPVPTEPVGGGAPVPPTTGTPSSGDAVGAALECPQGTQLLSRGVSICSDGVKAYAPVTALMHQMCMSAARSGCHEPLWDVDLYLDVRGAGACPPGAEWSERVSACVENSLVLGPFSSSFVSRCLASGFGNICVALKIDRSYFDLVNRNN